MGSVSAGTQMQNLFPVSLSNMFNSKKVILTRGQRRSLRGDFTVFWLTLLRQDTYSSQTTDNMHSPESL